MYLYVTYAKTHRNTFIYTCTLNEYRKELLNTYLHIYVEINVYICVYRSRYV